MTHLKGTADQKSVLLKNRCPEYSGAFKEKHSSLKIIVAQDEDRGPTYLLHD